MHWAGLSHCRVESLHGEAEAAAGLGANEVPQPMTDVCPESGGRGRMEKSAAIPRQTQGEAGFMRAGEPAAHSGDPSVSQASVPWFMLREVLMSLCDDGTIRI